MTAVFKGSQVVKKWGNGLGISISSSAARAAHLAPGTQVSVEVLPGGDLVVKTKSRLSLQQKLKLYDRSIHGGEFGTGTPLGAERF